MARQLSRSDVNHLRRLLGYVRCEIGQTPEEMVEMMKRLLPRLGPVSDEGKARLVQSHQQAARVPKYVRAAVKALEKHVKEIDGDVIDADTSAAKALSRKPLMIRP